MAFNPKIMGLRAIRMGIWDVHLLFFTLNSLRAQDLDLLIQSGVLKDGAMVVADNAAHPTKQEPAP